MIKRHSWKHAVSTSTTAPLVKERQLMININGIGQGLGKSPFGDMLFMYNIAYGIYNDNLYHYVLYSIGLYIMAIKIL